MNFVVEYGRGALAGGAVGLVSGVVGVIFVLDVASLDASDHRRDIVWCLIASVIVGGLLGLMDWWPLWAISTLVTMLAAYFAAEFFEIDRHR